MKLKRIMIVCISIVMVLGMIPLSGIVAFSEETENYGLLPDVEDRITTEATINNTRSGPSLPDSLDPRDSGILTDVQQQTFNSCWLYATTAGVEQYVSHKFGAKYNVSETHAMVALSNYIKPSNFINNAGYTGYDLCHGGFPSLALQYFTNWNAPLYYNDAFSWQASVSENSYPVTKIEESEFAIDDDFTDAEALFNVAGAMYISDDMNSIKSAVLQYGSVISPFGYKPQSTNLANGEYCYYYSDSLTPQTEFNHALLIVGWDDEFPKTNFRADNQPVNDGAWLVRDSNETIPYKWVSYDEASLCNSTFEKMCVITNVQKASNNEYMLSYNYLASKNSNVPLSSTVYMCNVFDVSEYNETYDVIKQAMIYLSVSGICNYEVKILPVDSLGNVASNYNYYDCLASGQYSGEGYITVDFDSDYDISSCQKCAVVVKVSPEIGSYCYVPYTVNHPNSSSNISYVGESQNGQISWINCHNMVPQYGFGGTIPIKAVLGKSTIVEDNISVTPNEVIANEFDVDISVSSIDKLFCIHTSDGTVLRQDIDYELSSNSVILYGEFTLDNAPAYLVLEFRNDTTKTVHLIPQSIITSVTVTGDPFVGNTLYAQCTGVPEHESYDVIYNWQYSSNGNYWTTITGVTSNQYVISSTLFGYYIRAVAIPFGNGNVSQGNTSSSTPVKVVILGDVNLNGSITSDDADLLSEYLAEMISLNDRQLLAADIDRDGLVTISDVTEIQRIVAGYV